MAEIVNKIKQSKLETIDLEKLLSDVSVKEFDLSEYLFQGLILKEKEFRDKLDNHNWEQYKGEYLAVFCSTDAIIPKWAYMLVVQHASESTKGVYFGNQEDVKAKVHKERLDQVDWEKYEDRFVLLKGCSKMDISAEIYMTATQKLLPHVKKLMYGEACSNVPVYKQKRSES
jgi:hypothetical protein